MSKQSTFYIAFDAAIATTLELGTLTKDLDKYFFRPKMEHKKIHGTICSNDLHRLVQLIIAISTNRDITTIQFL